MSGPLTTTEIEDVVSSVRRLVSADARPRILSRDLGAERLVLTPSLRVIAEPDAAPLILTHPTVDPAPVDAPASAPMVEAPWEDAIWQAPEAPLAERALDAEEAELVAPGDASATDDTVWAQNDPEEQDTAETATVIPFDAVAEAPAKAAAPVAETIAVRQKTTVLQPSGPDTTPADAPAGNPADNAAGDPTAALFDADGNPLTVLDEEALHDIVRQLIREELQGALGERITRNVRKLVRAEINRALTARSLD